MLLTKHLTICFYYPVFLLIIVSLSIMHNLNVNNL